jgi:hypothetical protein
MKKLLTRILQKFKYVKGLIQLINSYKCELKALQEDDTKRQYELWYNVENVSVVMYVTYKDNRNLQLCTIASIKVFPYGDDPEYAKLCAKELLDELNKEV